MKTLLVLHHTHTDIGYTETQGRIERWHVDFIRQAVRLARERPGFKWVCETFWGVERFWEVATPNEREEFVACVRAGAIDVSGHYLHLNELLGFDVLSRMTRRARTWADDNDVSLDSAMTADINGYSWGFATALLDAGIENLFTCIHTHHGMYPLGRTQVPFWWEAPDGRRLFVWSGEHYHFGNELGVVPGAVSSYLTKDECDADTIFHDHWRVAELRIPRYMAKFPDRDIVPVMASGLRTDNGPPNGAIMDFIDRWNGAHDDIRIEMATLRDFFAHAREEDAPVHRGDWPDWWSDGLGSMPNSVKLFRLAQRDLDLVRALESGPTDAIDQELTMFAEHTFSHSDAMRSPSYPLVTAISERKRAFAACAYEAVQKRLDAALDVNLRPDMPLRYRLLNPFPEPVRGIARLGVSHHEYHELDLDQGGEVWGGEERIASREVHVPRGAEFCVPVALAGGEERILELRPGERNEWAAEPFTWPAEVLRADHPHAPFAAVHEVTPSEGKDICGVRGEMVLNRKGENVQRTLLDGCETTLDEHPGEPRVDVLVRFHKQSVWDPENVYLALPFGPGELWLDKSGAAVRPRVDQIPGTLTDYYCIQDGFALVRDGFGIAVATPDTPLLQVGPLAYGPRRLAGDPALADEPEWLYAWVMNNFWETNFEASLGGFYEFRFSVMWGEHLADPAAALQACRTANRGITCVRLSS